MSGPFLLMGGAFLATLVVIAAVGGLVVMLGDGSQRKRRLQRAAGKRAVISGGSRQVSLRRDEVEGRFKSVELMLRRILPGRDKLRARLARTGFKISLGRYVMICTVVALMVAGAVLFVMGAQKWPIALGVGVVAGWLAPRLVIGYLAGRRVKKFLLELPEAIDVAVRGLKSGLPITETIAAISNDFEGPVGQEFKIVDDYVRMGTSLEEALWGVAERLDIPEFNFLAISIGVQRETGGNLTETLRNLSSLLRQRQQMRLKVRALSSEARASAYIIGVLPFAMAGIIYVVNPEYIGRLFEEPTGHMMLAGALISEMLGAAVMVKMVKFEI